MKIRIFKLALLSFSVLAILTSCNNKPLDVVPQFLRCGNSLVLANNGNLVIAGYNTSSSTGYDAMLMMRKASDGDTVWSKLFGGSYSNAFYSVKNTKDGGFVATGFTNRASAGSPAMYVVITDASGKMKYTKTYLGAAASQGFSIVPNADSGYLVAGVIQKTSNSDRNIYLVRINNSGDTLWTKSLGAKSTSQYDMVNDAAYAVIAAPTPDAGYYITGSLNGYTQYGGKIFLMKVSAKGDSLWTKTYSTGIGFSLTLTHENGVANGIAIGGSLQEGSSQDIFLLKTDLDGTLLWSKPFGGSGFDYGANIIETSDGGFAIAGITDSKGAGAQDAYLIKTTSSGALSWDKSYGKTDDDQGFGLVEMPLPNKGYAITGLSNSGGSYIFLNRVDENGTQFWTSPKYIE